MTNFVHQELQTTDTSAAKDFYVGLFGWASQDMPMGEGVYTMFSGPGGDVGGMMQGKPDAPPMWVGYVGVESIDAAIAKVESLGGTILVAKTEIPGMGTFIILKDPQGAVISAITYVNSE